MYCRHGGIKLWRKIESFESLNVDKDFADLNFCYTECIRYLNETPSATIPPQICALGHAIGRFRDAALSLAMEKEKSYKSALV